MTQPGAGRFSATAADGPFPWPDGRRAAVSLSFDDARPSQVERGIPLLNSFGLRATFYVSVTALERRLGAWKQAVRDGHEIGNHTLHHPCSANFLWKKSHMLEEYTLEQMESELEAADERIESLVGVRPRTFAYPCGQKFVGRGEETRSYVPLVARRFLAGRGFRDEFCNHPWRCDLAQLFGVDADRAPFEELRGWLEQTAQCDGWLVFCGHDTGMEGRQAMTTPTLESLCRFLADPAHGLWVDTVASVADFVARVRAPVRTGRV